MIYYQELLKEAKKAQNVLNQIKKYEAQLAHLEQNYSSLTAYGIADMKKVKARLNRLNPIFDHDFKIEKDLLHHQLDFQCSHE